MHNFQDRFLIIALTLQGASLLVFQRNKVSALREDKLNYSGTLKKVYSFQIQRSKFYLTMVKTLLSFWKQLLTLFLPQLNHF